MIADSTQSYTQIEEVREDVVFFTDTNAVLIIEISSTNFSLLSLDEQASKIMAYGSFLNSISFPIQIVINNKKVDISIYTNLLISEIAKIKDPKILDYMKKYRNFIETLVKTNSVLDKRFYLVIPHYFYEAKENYSIEAENDLRKSTMASLKVKAESVIAQFDRLGLKTKILKNDELVNLFKSFYQKGEDE